MTAWLNNTFVEVSTADVHNQVTVACDPRYTEAEREEMQRQQQERERRIEEKGVRQ